MQDRHFPLIWYVSHSEFRWRVVRSSFWLITLSPRKPNELRIHVARRGEQVTVLSRHTTDDGPGWVEAKAATKSRA